MRYKQWFDVYVHGAMQERTNFKDIKVAIINVTKVIFRVEFRDP